MSAALGVRLALGGLGARGPWVAAGLGLVTVAIASLLERVREPAYAADRVLLGATLGIVVPLVGYALFESVYGKERTTAVIEPLGRHGADRRLLALGVNGVLATCSAAVTAVLAAVAAISARGFGDPEVAGDFTASLWSGALTGAAYAGLFAVASVFARRGRIVALVLDWLFGSGAGLFALPWPRAHARNLFGGEPVFETSQTLAALALFGLAFAGIVVASLRETR